jgi:hypothetical protein
MCEHRVPSDLPPPEPLPALNPAPLREHGCVRTLHVVGQFAADHACTLAHFVTASGGRGLEDLDFGPPSTSLTANAARNLRAVLNKD